jgi:hypothetical protein
MVPHITDRELQDPARFVGCARLTAAFYAAEDDQQRRKIVARVRYEHARWTKPIPLTWQQERRIAGFWKGQHLTAASTPTGLKRPGRPTSDLTALADALRARIEQNSGLPWERIPEAERRRLVVGLSTRNETSAAAGLLGCSRRTIARMRKEATR